MAAPIGHNSATRKYTAAEVESAIRISLRGEHIREDRSFMHRVRWELWLSKLSMRSKIVGLAILEHADKDGSNAFPSMDRLRVMVGGSKRDIKDAVDEFIKWEFVTFKEGRGRRSNEYRFHLSLADLADYVDGSNVVPLRLSDGTTKSRCGTTVVPQDDNHSGTTVVPQDAVADEFVVPFSPVVVPSVHGCGTISPSAILRTRADLLTDLQDLQGGKVPDGFRNTVAAATVAVMSTIAPIAAAADPTPQTIEALASPGLASCWNTPKSQMAAALNSYEGKAQRQIWTTPTGCVEVDGEFRRELEEKFPTVDLVSGLAAAGPHVAKASTALEMMIQVRRQFGYLKQDAQRFANAYAERQKNKNTQQKTERPREYTASPIKMDMPDWDKIPW